MTNAEIEKEVDHNRVATSMITRLFILSVTLFLSSPAFSMKTLDYCTSGQDLVPLRIPMLGSSEQLVYEFLPKTKTKLYCFNHFIDLANRLHPIELVEHD